MTDDSIMPFGKYKGEKLGNVDANYLLWLYEQWQEAPPTTDTQRGLKAYIESNKDVLEMERNQRKRV